MELNRSLIDAIDINDVPLAAQILEELSTKPYAHSSIINVALEKAIENKSLPLLKLLYTSDLFTGHGKAEMSAFMMRCVSSDFPEGVEYLLSPFLEQGTNDYPTVLLQCAKEDKLETIKYLLAIPERKKYPDMEQSLIRHACEQQSVQVLSYLVNSDQGKIINSISASRYTPLHWCLFSEKSSQILKCVAILLQAGVDPNIADEDGLTALFHVIYVQPNIYSVSPSVVGLHITEGLAIVSMLVKAGARVNDVYPFRGCQITPICMAAQNEMPSVVTYLMDHGADINLSTETQDNLLHYLARSKNTSDEMVHCVDSLIVAGLSVNKTNASNQTPLYLAALNSNKIVLEALVEANCDLNAICDETCESSLTRIRQVNEYFYQVTLLRYMFGVSEQFLSRDLTFGKTNNANTALMVTLDNRDWDLAELLLMAGADPDVKCQQGKTALMVAIENNIINLTEMLLKSRADVNVKDNCGRTALMLAVKNIAKYLSNMPLQDNNERLAITVAIINNNKTLTEMLLNSGADPNIKDDMGRTALIHFMYDHLYIHCNRSLLLNKMLIKEVLDCLKMLVEAGANVENSYVTHRQTLTPISMAVEKGISSVVIYLMDHGSNIRFNSENEDTILHHLARSNDRTEDMTQCVEKVIKAGFDVNKVNLDNETPLYVSAKNSNETVLEALIKAKCDLNILCGVISGCKYEHLVMTKQSTSAISVYGGKTAFMEVVDNADSNLIQVLFRAGVDINATDCFGRTALFVSVQNQSIKLTETLLELGMDPNIKDTNGRTVLMVTVLMMNNSKEMVEVLLKARADPNIKDKNGHTALLHLMYQHTYRPFYEYDSSRLMTSIFEIVKIMVEAGATVNDGYQIEKVPEHKLTPIYMAAKKGLPVIVMYLMDHGSDLNISTEKQDSILHYLARSSNKSDEMVQCIDKLIKAGMSVDNVNVINETPAYLAVCSSNKKVLETLIKSNCELNSLFGDTKSSLLTTSIKQTSNTDVSEILLSAGCDVNLPDEHGTTPLLQAARCQRVELMVLLLKHGAQVNIVDLENNDCTPLMSAVKIMNKHLIDTVLQAGAVVNIKDGKGCTALHYMNGRPKSRTWISIMKLLLMNGCDTSIECTMNHINGLMDCVMKTNSVKFVWFCITENWYPNGTTLMVHPTKIFGIEDKLKLAKCLYSSGVAQSVIYCLLSEEDNQDNDNESTDQKEDQQNQYTLFREYCISENLKSRCRRVVRRCLGSNIKEKIKGIELPTKVEDFILLKDVIPEEYFTLTVDDDYLSDDDDDGDDYGYDYGCYYDGFSSDNSYDGFSQGFIEYYLDSDSDYSF